MTVSVLVNDNANFIALLINTTQLQAEALLDTASRKQVKVISLICKNLLKFPLEQDAKNEVEKHHKLLEKLGSSSIGLSKKGHLIGLHRKKIIRVFKSTSVYLSGLIGRIQEGEKIDSEIAEKSQDIPEDKNVN